MSHPTNHERPDPAYATRASAGQLPRGGGAVSVHDSVMGGPPSGSVLAAAAFMTSPCAATASGWPSSAAAAASSAGPRPEPIARH
jgi:hypothetical protein